MRADSKNKIGKQVMFKDISPEIVKRGCQKQTPVKINVMDLKNAVQGNRI